VGTAMLQYRGTADDDDDDADGHGERNHEMSAIFYE